MELSVDMVSTASSIKTETLSFASGSLHPTNLCSESLVNVKNGNMPVNNQDDNSAQHSIYNLMCPWDYLVNFSNVSSVSSNVKSQNVYSVQVQSLINNFELLINQFKILLESSCSLHTRPMDEMDDNEKDDNENTIGLTDNLSVVLGYAKPIQLHLVVTDANKITREYERCCNVLDAVIDTITYKDLPEQSCGAEDLPQLSNVKVELGTCCATP